MTYSYEDLSQIWAKGIPVATHDQNYSRMDEAGNWIVWNEYGKRTQFGWEVDHIIPVSRGGTNAFSNLQPLHWRANRAKADKWTI